MSCSINRPVALAGCGLVLLPLLGCVFAADLVNPNLLTQLGLDPGTILPPPGKVVVAFNNQTDRVVRFYAYAQPDVAPGGSNTETDVAPGAVSSRAFDCPISALAPGEINADLSISNVGATYDIGGAAPTDVTYTGSPVFGERGDFVCGDVIEIQLIQRAAAGGEDDEGAQAQFEFRVQVHAGR